MAFAVVLDSNVLYSVALTDLFITLTGSGFYRVHWSPDILDEALRNLIEQNPGKEGALRERFEDMTSAEPSALVDPPPELIAAMTNDPKDRHVLAAAVHARAEVIVTFNLADFPAESCEPHFIEAQHPDEFTSYSVDVDPAAIWRAIQRMAGRRSRPPQSPEDVLTYLEENYLPQSMARLRSWILEQT